MADIKLNHCRERQCPGVCAVPGGLRAQLGDHVARQSPGSLSFPGSRLSLDFHASAPLLGDRVASPSSQLLAPLPASASTWEPTSCQPTGPGPPPGLGIQMHFPGVPWTSGEWGSKATPTVLSPWPEAAAASQGHGRLPPSLGAAPPLLSASPAALVATQPAQLLLPQAWLTQCPLCHVGCTLHPVPSAPPAGLYLLPELPKPALALLGPCSSVLVASEGGSARPGRTPRGGSHPDGLSGPRLELQRPQAGTEPAWPLGLQIWAGTAGDQRPGGVEEERSAQAASPPPGFTWLPHRMFQNPPSTFPWPPGSAA